MTIGGTDASQVIQDDYERAITWLEQVEQGLIAVPRLESGGVLGSGRRISGPTYFCNQARTPTMSRLTQARRSVWDAIDHWPALDKVFRQKYRFESKPQEGRPAEASHRPESPTSIADLPAIAIMPSAVTPKWATNLQKDHPYSLDIVYWTSGAIRRHEREVLLDELIKVIYQSRPEVEPRHRHVPSKRGTG